MGQTDLEAATTLHLTVNAKSLAVRTLFPDNPIGMDTPMGSAKRIDFSDGKTLQFRDHPRVARPAWGQLRMLVHSRKPKENVAPRCGANVIGTRLIRLAGQHSESAERNAAKARYEARPWDAQRFSR